MNKSARSLKRANFGNYRGIKILAPAGFLRDVQAHL